MTVSLVMLPCITCSSRCFSKVPPAECTMHLGAPVVPDEYIIKRGWSNGSWANSRGMLASPWSLQPVARNSSNVQLSWE